MKSHWETSSKIKTAQGKRVKSENRWQGLMKRSVIKRSLTIGMTGVGRKKTEQYRAAPNSKKHGLFTGIR